MQIPPPEIENFFAVPIGRVTFPDHEPLCEELSRLFLEKAGQGDRFRHQKHIDTMHGELFESRFDLFRWPDEPIRVLAGLCHQAVAQHVQQTNSYDEAEMEMLRFDYHAWFHVTRKHGYQGLHNHPGASWSGIFCVDPGEEVPGRPDSGMVRFHDPRTHIDMYSDAGNRNLKTPWSMGSVNWHHRRGQLVLFPSYLRHEVYPYVGDRPRIVAAFNCWIGRSDQRHAPRGDRLV